MSDTGTTAELIELAIRAEREGERFYQVLAERFALLPEVATFWKHYAAEEHGHMRWLEQLRERCTPEQLAAPADERILSQARKTGLTGAELANRIRDLQEAYDLANELEHSETNAIFEFIIEHFSRDEQAVPFLRNQLHNHASRLTREFPTAYQDITLRRSIFPK